MSLNLGINLVEVDGATPSIQGAATSVAGFVIRSQRGVPGVVRQVTNFTQFTDYFGGYVDSKDANGVQTAHVGAYAVRGFFDNGGTLAYVTRVVATANVAESGTTPAITGALPASATLPAAAAAGATGPGATALTVTAAFRGEADPGAWGNSIGVGITANPNVTGAFDLTVARLDANGRVVSILETWTKLRIGGGNGTQAPESLNDPNTGSKYVMIAVSGTAPPAPTTTGSGATTTPAPRALAGGRDDTLAAGSTLLTALAAAVTSPSPFDSYDIQLLACPETTDRSVVQAALTYCADRGDCMFVGHVAYGVTPTAAKTYGQMLQGNKVYGAIYYPYIQVIDPIGTLIWIPPTGHVLGVYARTDQQRGIWKAPAGNAALVGNALDVRTRLSDTEHTDLVKNGSVNAIRPISGAGIVIDSSRTLSTNTLWLYVNVRLLFNYVKTSLKYGLRWVVQEPNDPTLWKKLNFNSVTPFLTNLWRRGAFGPGAPADVFRVKVDEENNPPDSIQRGILNVEVYFYPSRPAETIVITVGQQEGGAQASER